MAILLQFPTYDTLAQPKRQLTVAIDAGAVSALVVSVEGLSVGDLAILGIPLAPTAELIKLTSVSSSTGVGFAACKYAHDAEGATAEFITRIPFDQIKIYSGTSTDITTHTLLTTINMAVSSNTTSYIDTTGTGQTFYSYSYYNSQVSTPYEGPRVIYFGPGTSFDITPDYLKTNFLYGLDLTDDNGYPLPDSLYWHGILTGVAWLEQELNIDILNRAYVNEESDFDNPDYLNFVFIKTKHYPVIPRSVTRIAAQYYGSIVEFPVDWLRLKDRLGIINLVPTGTSFSRFIMGASGGILPLLSGTQSRIPGFWQISYSSGFAPGQVPMNIKDMICKRACAMPLNILGDLVGGVAIASKSLGLDGLSQSINTTSSPENSGYSARLRMYATEIKTELPALKTYWGRQTLTIL